MNNTLYSLSKFKISLPPEFFLSIELATYHKWYLLMCVLRAEIFGTSDYLWVYTGNFFKIRETENISIASLMKQYRGIFSTCNS